MAVAADERVDRLRMSASRSIDLDRVGRLTFASTCTALGLCVAGLMLYQATRRPPWGDEMASHYFVASPGEFLSRYRTDPHPLGYYLPLLVLAQISKSVAFLRIAGLTAFAAAAILLAVFTTSRRSELGRLLCLAGVGCFGTAAFVEWGTELRMYGALGVCAAVLSVTVFHWLDDPAPTEWSAVALVGLLTLTASVHVWGALVAVPYGCIVVARAVADRRLRTPVGFAFGAAGVVLGLAYAWGPLSRRNVTEFLTFDEAAYVGWLIGGVGVNFGVVVTLAGLWLVAATMQPSRRMMIAFDIPVVVVVLAAWLVSQRVPIVKVYSVIPVLVIAVTGLVIRLRSVSAWLASAAVGVLLVSSMIVAADLGRERLAYGATTEYLVENINPDDACPILVTPTNLELHDIRHLIGDGWNLAPLTPDVLASGEMCREGWIIANHLYRDRSKFWPRIEALVDVEVVMTGRGSDGDGIVGRYRIP